MPQLHKEKRHVHFRKRAMRLLESGKRSIRRMLMSKKHREKIDSKLNLVFSQGNYHEIARLVKAGADVNMRTARGSTLLMTGAYWNYMDLCKLLLERGADVNAKDIEGKTALMRAAKNGHLEMCKLLLDHGASPHARDLKGRTPLGYAMEGNRTKTLEFLKHWRHA
jgi:ankyrin repeat protein